MKRLAALAACWCLLGAGPPPKPAATGPAPPKPSASGLPGEFSNVGGFDTITTRTIDTNLNTGVFSVPQHFTASRQGTEISADKATGNTKQKIVHATGNVIVHQNGPVQAQGEAAKFNSQDPSTLTCDKLNVDGTRKYYVATGNVHFTQAGRDATADRGTLNEVTNELHLHGNVHIRDRDQYLDGDNVVYNTKTGDVRASGNPVMVRAPVATPGPPGLGPTPAPTKKPKH